MGRFDNKVAIVTGAAGGIGEAYARALAAEGANVVIADVDAEKGEAVASSITENGGGKSIFVTTDVSSEESTQAMAQAAVEAFGGIDYLVNNAAIYGGMALDSLLNVDLDYLHKFMSVNLTGALLCTRAVYPHMKKSESGAIVNQSSTAAWLYASFYGLSKAAMNSLTHQLAHECGNDGIRVNGIAPGPTQTEATKKQVGSYVDELVKGLALKRAGEPEDMVGACLFLLSEDSAWITGQTLNVDGGQVYRA